MSSLSRRALALVVAVLALAPPAAAQGPPDQPWRDPGRAAAQRADALLAALSFEQKVAIALGDFASVASLGVPPLTFADGPSGIRAEATAPARPSRRRT